MAVPPASLDKPVPRLPLLMRLWATIIPAMIAGAITAALVLEARFLSDAAPAALRAGGLPKAVEIALAGLFLTGAMGALFGFPAAFVVLFAAFTVFGRPRSSTVTYMRLGAGAGAVHSAIGLVFHLVQLTLGVAFPTAQVFGGFLLASTTSVMALTAVPAAIMAGAVAGFIYARSSQVLARPVRQTG